MQKIFTGMLLIFLDFNINLGASSIDVIPDFLGYYFMLQGLEELAALSGRFVQARPYVKGMAVYTAILFVLDLLGVTTSAGLLTWVLALVSTGISLYISYEIVLGVADMESALQKSLNSAELYARWKIYAYLSAAIFFLYLIPGLNILAILAGFVAAIVFLISFHRAKQLYYAG